MKNASSSGVNISILGKEFTVACPDSERTALMGAARELDRRMREVQDSGKVIGTERCAIIAALNLANELLALRDQQNALPPDLDRRLQSLVGRIDSVLHS
jgi:cell division protein ZapA